MTPPIAFRMVCCAPYSVTSANGALEGPPEEVLFPQEHVPGHRGLSDFTTMGELRSTIANVPFGHILYHFVLAFLCLDHVEVVESGESFEALSKGLQNARWQADNVPLEQRSDSLSTAFKNLAEEEDFTARHTALLDHYDVIDTRTRPCCLTPSNFGQLDGSRRRFIAG